ncbi:polyadenylate-binding protein-interacting protein 9-like [Zingiber officinale]|uniref:polyadenylate-binding protein-interacting protein 9-like n=1 Tax=Zingiber officinale TaxID=94328 RepID=UPI001C4CC542|nr:polyadenylate-binding protein-interacting protein 9-like [Zingiber officinale]
MADLTARKRFQTRSASPFSGLNPSAEEFVPPSLLPPGLSSPPDQHRVYVPRDSRAGASDHPTPRRRNYSLLDMRNRFDRIPMAQYGESVRRTVFVSNLDQQITEEQLVESFRCCGKVLDCRICGDCSSVLRFAFVEYANENGAKQALNLDGCVLGNHPVKVIPSKTPIVPVNPIFLPRSEDEREQCARTVYCSNIDKQLSPADVKHFFESLCGQVSRLRLLADQGNATCISFVEFAEAESSIAALNCTGLFLGSNAIRVSPSKTPIKNIANINPRVQD